MSILYQKGGTTPFEKWYAKTSNALDIDPNYNSPLHYYDYKGFYNKYGDVDMTKGQHFTDEFKRPGHPTFSNQSKYSNTTTPGGDWTQMDDKSFMFTHSPLTNKHYNRTAGYLQGTGERAALPTVNVYSKKK